MFGEKMQRTECEGSDQGPGVIATRATSKLVHQSTGTPSAVAQVQLNLLLMKQLEFQFKITLKETA